MASVENIRGLEFHSRVLESLKLSASLEDEYKDNVSLEAVRLSINDALVSAVKKISMIFTGFNMRGMLGPDVDWRSTARLVLGYKDSYDIPGYMRGIVLAICETESVKIFGEPDPDKLNGTMDVSEILEAMKASSILLNGEEIWSFSDNSRNIQREAKFEKIGLFVRSNMNCDVPVPLILESCEYHKDMPVPELPYKLFREVATVHTVYERYGTVLGSIVDSKHRIINTSDIQVSAIRSRYVVDIEDDPLPEITVLTRAAYLQIIREFEQTFPEGLSAKPRPADLFYKALLQSAIFWAGLPDHMDIKIRRRISQRCNVFSILRSTEYICRLFRGDGKTVFSSYGDSRLGPYGLSPSSLFVEAVAQYSQSNSAAMTGLLDPAEESLPYVLVLLLISKLKRLPDKSAYTNDMDDVIDFSRRFGVILLEEITKIALCFSGKENATDEEIDAIVAENEYFVKSLKIACGYIFTEVKTEAAEFPDCILKIVSRIRG